ncbi:PREDICTED: uncharacterized protein LOC105560314 [Vollenhovia emeryi]|uniref:uncharacterized protein LOC105560314 n=1 Tax=Vollenhovia emeryi TaxID=411798 RepID=UPI0005F549C0|nr:PREDICTED: uncharacterized protein LOC105560314 [Vollenhovia emeryi]
MLVPTIRRGVLCGLRRAAACVTYRSKMRTRIARQGSEPNFLPVSSLSATASRIYSTKSDSEPEVSLPMLVDGANIYTPNFLFPLRFFFKFFWTIPQIDREFDLHEVHTGVKHAVTVISKALANQDYDSLEGLVEEDVIQVLRAKIETLSPEQRSLIAINKEDIVQFLFCDVIVVADKEHSIEIKTLCTYFPAGRYKDLTKLSINTMLSANLFCNYTFIRKYVNNVGSPWIVTFVNHCTLNTIFK